MNRTHFHTAGVLCAMLLAVAGCAQTPNLDSHFGEAVNLVKAQQTLHPEASRNTDPVTGMDGKAAMSAYGAYQKSYKAPEPQASPFAIGVGAGSAR